MLNFFAEKMWVAFAVLYICVKFRENITNGIRVMELKRRIGYVQCSKGNNSKSRQTAVMVHVFCMSSDGALHFVWSFLKISQTVSELQSGHEIMKRWQTDTQNLRRYNIIPHHFFVAGHNKKSIQYPDRCFFHILHENLWYSLEALQRDTSYE